MGKWAQNIQKSIFSHNFWLECPRDLRSTSLSCIFDAFFGDTPFGSWSPYSTDTDFSSLDIYICQLSRRWQPFLGGCKKFEPSLRPGKSIYGWFIFRICIVCVWQGQYWRRNDKKRLKNHQNWCFFTLIVSCLKWGAATCNCISERSIFPLTNLINAILIDL